MDDTVLAALNNLAMLKASYNNQSNQGLAIGVSAVVREIQNLINSTPIARYEIEVSQGASLPNFEISDIGVQGTGTIDILLGGGVELEKRQTSLKTEGVVMLGKMYPLAEYEPYNGPSGKSFGDLLGNALQGAWLLVKDSFINIAKTIESGVAWVVDLLTPNGGAMITGSTVIPVNPMASASGMHATTGTTVTVSAVGWTQNEFAVGGIYKFSPEGTTFVPGATLSLTYTQSAATGLDETKFLIYHWNATNDNWTPLPSHVYSATNLLTTTITHLGTYAIGYDATSPQITPLIPITNGATIEGYFPPLSVIITDTGSGINPSSITMGLNNQVVPSLYDSYFHVAWYTPTLPLANGNYALTVSAQDMAGNLSSAALSFKINVHYELYLPTIAKSH